MCRDMCAHMRVDMCLDMCTGSFRKISGRAWPSERIIEGTVLCMDVCVDMHADMHADSFARELGPQ